MEIFCKKTDVKKGIVEVVNDCKTLADTFTFFNLYFEDREDEYYLDDDYKVKGVIGHGCSVIVFIEDACGHDQCTMVFMEYNERERDIIAERFCKLKGE